MKNKDKVMCFECSEYINTKDEKYAKLSTMNMLGGKDDHKYYHFPCWVDYIRKTIGDREKNQKYVEAQNFMANNPEMMQMAKTMVKSFMNGLQYEKQDDQVKKMVIKRINNDRRTKKKSKTKY